jgi:hypothetical protein
MRLLLLTLLPHGLACVGNTEGVHLSTIRLSSLQDESRNDSSDFTGQLCVRTRRCICSGHLHVLKKVFRPAKMKRLCVSGLQV